jgi:hypothetical protein
MVRERELSSVSTQASIPLNFVLPAGEALPQPPLSALLGQVQINATEFCKLFNIKSLENYYSGTLLNVFVIKKSDNRFSIAIRGVFLPFLFFQGSNFSSKIIYIENLFDLFQIFCLDRNLVKNQKNARIFFGTFRCSKFKIRLLKNILFL